MRLMGFMGGGRWLSMLMAWSVSTWAASASAQTTNSPLFEPSPGTAAPAMPSVPAWQGVQDGHGRGGGGFYTPYSPPTAAPSAGPYPMAPQAAFPSRNFPADRTPALRDLTQRPASPLENAARDAGVRQQVYPAPAIGPGYGR